MAKDSICLAQMAALTGKLRKVSGSQLSRGTVAQIALKMPRKSKIEGHRINFLNTVFSKKLNGASSGDKAIERKPCLDAQKLA